MRWGFTLLAFISLGLSQAAYGQAVSAVPDGATDTTVTYDTTGRALVDIAAPVSDGISHNTFTRFNVTEAGLDFDNRFAGARTIISEVTGSERSLIEGDIEILGQRAHLFIANPNGILVDGSEFINTGGVALSTGTIDFVERVPAPFRTQLNTTLDVTRGEIVIGEGGLSGAMDTLHFLSKSLRIEGPVTNTNNSPFAGIEITIGNSSAEFDSSLLPQNDLSQWSTVVAGDAEAEQAFLIDITETGALTASQITALVTDSGGGVRHAGSILADRQGFTLTTDGQIVIDGGETVAASNIRYEGREIEVRGVVPPAPPEPVQVAELTFDAEDVSPFSRTDQDLLTGPGDIDLPEIDIGLPEPQEEEIEETRSVFNAAGGGVDLIATQGAITIGPALFSSNLDINLSTPKDISLDSVEMFTGAAIDWEATSISIDSSEARSFIATNETLNLTSTEGSITIDGARLQGAVSQDDTDEASYALQFVSAEDIILRSIDGDNLAVLFGIEGDVSLESNGNILNHTGRVISNGDISFIASGDIDNIIALPDGSRDPLILQGSHTGAPAWWTGFTQGRSIRETVIDYGEFDIEGQLAFITATGGVNLTAAGDIRNIGGQINANDGDVNLLARNIISEGLVSGRLDYDRRCLILCSSRASSTLNVSGGLISASGTLNLTAEGFIENRGGFLTGLEGVNLNADRVVFESVFLPQIVDRPGGLYNFWSGHSAWLYWRDTLGGVFADGNDIEITGAKEVLLRGVEIENLLSNIEPIVVYAPRQIGNANDQSIGFFHELAPILGN